MDSSIENYETAVREYCALIEVVREVTSSQFVDECLKLVLRLYEGVLCLPEVPPGTHEVVSRVGSEETSAIRRRVSDRLDKDYYWAPEETWGSDPPQLTAGMLSDDLADIWQELKDGLLTLDVEGPDRINDVVRHWRFSFECHWGDHAAGAISALHALR